MANRKVRIIEKVKREESAPLPAKCAIPASPLSPAPAAKTLTVPGRRFPGLPGPRPHSFLATSDLHLQCKLKITRDDA